MQLILVIDDDESLRDTISLMLEKEGYRPVLAADGLTGLQEAYATNPALILVDLRMPGLGGIEVCKRVRAAGMKTPIIVLSAIGEEVDKVLLLEIGADDYVVKPFGARELLARIRAVLRRSAPDAHAVIAFSDVEVDLEHRIVRRHGEEVQDDPRRVQPAGLLSSESRKTVDARCSSELGVGLRLLPEHAHSGCTRR